MLLYRGKLDALNLGDDCDCKGEVVYSGFPVLATSRLPGEEADELLP